MKQFFEEDVDAWLAEDGESDCTVLAETHCHAELKELAAAARAFDKAFMKIRKVFPDAEIYSANDGLTLVLGGTHENGERARQDRCVVIDKWPPMVYISGGDW